MDASWYQDFKQVLISWVPLDKDAWHIYIGMVCLVASSLGLRLPLIRFRALALGVAVSLALEVLDLWHDYAISGIPNWLASLNDIVNTNAIPALIVVLIRWQGTRRQPVPDT